MVKIYKMEEDVDFSLSSPILFHLPPLSLTAMTLLHLSPLFLKVMTLLQYFQPLLLVFEYLQLVLEKICQYLETVLVTSEHCLGDVAVKVDVDVEVGCAEGLMS